MTRKIQKPDFEAKDCSKIEINDKQQALTDFIRQSNTFNRLNFKQDKDELEIIHFYRGDWWAGRMVGEATFRSKAGRKNKEYKLIIRPRFGMVHLFRMFEVINNVRIVDNSADYLKSNDQSSIIKHLIKFLWLNLLSKANKHGLPRQNYKKQHIGTSIRGRLNPRKSIIPLYSRSKLISQFREKEPDPIVIQVLNQAYDILNRDYSFSNLEISPNAKNAIDYLNVFKSNKQKVSTHEFQNIKLNGLFANYKPLLDLSWQIIQSNVDNLKQKSSNKDSFSLFIDMAELWELYLKALLTRHFSESGWTVKSPNIPIYQTKDFSRSIIPDIVMERDDEIMVFDAKYKNMKYEQYDYDRADFFQIHTYMSYYHQDKILIAGGLLYPLSDEYTGEVKDKNHSDFLFKNRDGKPIKFCVDGIDLSGLNLNSSTKEQRDYITAEENKFTMRIEKLIEIQE